jgi:hypothetical protein
VRDLSPAAAFVFHSVVSTSGSICCRPVSSFCSPSRTSTLSCP